MISNGETQWLLAGNHNNHNDNGEQQERDDRWSPLARILIFFVASMILIVPLKTVVGMQENLPPRSALRTLSPQPREEETLQQVANQSLELLHTGFLPILPIHGTNIHHPYCETTVLLIRHCDDHGMYARDDEESGDKHCSHMGYERTQYLPTLFGPRARWPHPSFLYALLPDQPLGTNYRQIETLLPLATRENIPIHVVKQPQQVSLAMLEWLQTATLDDICDSVTVVAWKHAFIPELAAYLGCGPEQGCRETYPDDDFDLVWELKYVFRPTEPLDEVLDLVRAQSPLIADDYNLLVTLDEDKETVSADDNQDDTSLDNNNTDGDIPAASSLGWTVYGSMTSQRFDPLAFDNDRLKTFKDNEPKEEGDDAIYQIR